MDKPTTIINVKSVPVDAWEQAKRAAEPARGVLRITDGGRDNG
jgi:hypothetical protein